MEMFGSNLWGKECLEELAIDGGSPVDDVQGLRLLRDGQHPCASVLRLVTLHLEVLDHPAVRDGSSNKKLATTRN